MTEVCTADRANIAEIATLAAASLPQAWPQGLFEQEFRLPEARKVTELFEDRTVSDSPVMEFTETFEPMETRLYWLEGN